MGKRKEGHEGTKPRCCVPKFSLNGKFFITARRYASAVYVVIVCPSVCLSAKSRYANWYIETTGRIEPVLAWRLPSTYPTLCYKEFVYLQKLGYLNPLGLCLKSRT